MNITYKLRWDNCSHPNNACSTSAFLFIQISFEICLSYFLNKCFVIPVPRLQHIYKNLLQGRYRLMRISSEICISASVQWVLLSFTDMWWHFWECANYKGSLVQKMIRWVVGIKQFQKKSWAVNLNPHIKSKSFGFIESIWVQLSIFHTEVKDNDR